MSREEQVNSIIQANLYMVRCKFCVNCQKRTEYARRFLNMKVNRLLSGTKKVERVSLSSIFLVIFAYFW
jgi:hypothetical protein